MWFHALANALLIEAQKNESQNGQTEAQLSSMLIQRELPNVREYPMKGVGTYRCLYFAFVMAGFLELFGLVFWFVIGLQPCDPSRPAVNCALILGTSLDQLSCQPEPFNGVFSVPPQFWLELAGVQDVACFHSPPVGRAVRFYMLHIQSKPSYYLIFSTIFKLYIKSYAIFKNIQNIQQNI